VVPGSNSTVASDSANTAVAKANSHGGDASTGR
jgi:hypothetical protein